jgi:hypothetical protein
MAGSGPRHNGLNAGKHVGAFLGGWVLHVWQIVMYVPSGAEPPPKGFTAVWATGLNTAPYLDTERLESQGVPSSK